LARLLMLVAALAAILPAAPACGQGRLSERGAVSQTVAGTTIAVEYYRPVARGRGNLFGGVVHWGENWTPGANWATTVEVDHEVRVEGQRLPKGKYGLWIVVRPDTWTVSFHRRARRFHTDRPDSTDEALRLTVRPDSGPHTEVLTFDFPEMAATHTVLRLRWGTVVVPLRISAMAPPLGLITDPVVRRAYLGRYEAETLPDGLRMGLDPGRGRVDIGESGDTLVWNEASRSGKADRIVLSTAGEDAFTWARRDSTGQFWNEPGVIVSFTRTNGRATAFEVEMESGAVASRGTRMP
jgi:Protein of unknown function (DUF2911)